MSEGLSLRVLEKEDLAFIHQLHNNAEIMSYWFEEAHRSMAQLEDFYDKNMHNKNSRQFILTDGEEDIGYVALFFIDFIHRKAEYAIMIDPKHQGKGYAKIATRLAMDYAFRTLNLNKLYLIVDEVNEKAIHVYEKAGYKVEGVLKEEYFINGKYHNSVMMGIFQRDYLNMD